MSIGMKKSIPGYKSRWTGRQIDSMMQKIMESFDSAHLVIPSTEAVPFNIDCLLDLGHFSIEYITKSTLPAPLLEMDIRPYDVSNVMIDGMLHQIIHTISDTYVRSYDPDNPVGIGNIHDCDCNCDCHPNVPKGTWSSWTHLSTDVPDDVVVAVDGAPFPEIESPEEPVDAEYVIIHKTDGSFVTLQQYYEDGLLSGGGNTDVPGNENDDPVSQTTPVQWRADKVTILHRGIPYSLSDIMDKILSL